MPFEVLSPLVTSPNTKFRVFVFPHAGGSNLSFLDWIPITPSEAEIFVISAPHQFAAYKKTAVADLTEYFDSLLPALAPLADDAPCAFFGHSAGASLALLTIQKLRSAGVVLPRLLVVSGANADLSPPADLLEDLPTKIQQWGGTSAEVIQDASAMSQLCESIAADLNFHVQCCSAIDKRAALDLPIRALYGKSDAEVSLDLIQAWKQFSLRPLEVEAFDGDHFYFQGALCGRVLGTLFDRLSHQISEQRKEAEIRIAEWNSNFMEWPRDAVLHEQFRAQAARTPDAVAVVDPAQGLTMTFRELDVASDGLAWLLYGAGVRCNTTVGILMDRCAEYMVAYIAALKADGAYMPLETAYPKDLMHRVCEEAKPVIVCGKQPYLAKCPASQRTFEFSGDWLQTLSKLGLDHPQLPVDRERAGPDSLAYVVMSSGTTGVPKGICCPHRGAVYSYFWRHEHYPFHDSDRVACNVFFVWECLRPLLRGKPTYIIPDFVIYDPTALIAFLQEHCITRILFTPSLLQLILDTVPATALQSALKGLELIWLCGEVVTIELRNKAMSALPHIKLLNLYSISECHDVAVGDLNHVDLTLTPKFASCGKVMANVEVYVLDSELHPVPIGSAGEVYVSGPCVAIGYLNRPEITAERFPVNVMAHTRTADAVKVGNPASGPELRMYRTGDRGRLLRNGELELLGRCDFMVKVRGYSVVLGQVETALCEHAEVSTAVVLAVGSEGTDKRLVAYVVPAAWDHKIPSQQELQGFLASRIPSYAIPTQIIALESLPVHPVSGKLDRKQLPNLGSGAVQGAATTADTTARDAPVLDERTSSKVSASTITSPGQTAAQQFKLMLAPILGMSAADIDMQRTFQEVGGHSLLAARVASAIDETFGVKVPLPDILFATSLARILSIVQPTDVGSTVQTLRDVVLAPILGMSAADIDMQRTFQEVGGHSLLAARVASAIDETFGVKVPLPDILFATSLHTLSSTITRMQNGNTSDAGSSSQAAAADQLVVDCQLDPMIFPAATRKTGYARYRFAFAGRPPSRLLLTGCTGYLGSMALKSILRWTPARVYCLVRASDSSVALDRIRGALDFAQCRPREIEDFLERIVPICGDLNAPALGLQDSEFKGLAGEVDAIVHAAADVNLMKQYGQVRASNVLGTREVLRLAVTNGIFERDATRVKPVHLISTNGVFPPGSCAAGESDEIYNDSYGDKLPNGYAQSKWVAERLVSEAGSRGLPISILRAGNMCADAETLQFNSSDFVVHFVQACAAIGAVPSLDSLPGTWTFDLTPVDFAADAIACLCVNRPDLIMGSTLHLQTSSSAVSAAELLDTIRKVAGAEVLAYQTWTGRVTSMAERHQSVAALAVALEQYVGYFSDGLKFDNSNFLSAIAQYKLRSRSGVPAVMREDALRESGYVQAFVKACISTV